MSKHDIYPAAEIFRSIAALPAAGVPDPCPLPDVAEESPKILSRAYLAFWLPLAPAARVSPNLKVRNFHFRVDSYHLRRYIHKAYFMYVYHLFRDMLSAGEMLHTRTAITTTAITTTCNAGDTT